MLLTWGLCIPAGQSLREFGNPPESFFNVYPRGLVVWRGSPHLLPAFRWDLSETLKILE